MVCTDFLIGVRYKFVDTKLDSKYDYFWSKLKIMIYRCFHCLVNVLFRRFALLTYRILYVLLSYNKAVDPTTSMI